MIGPILRRARKGNSRRIIMEARLSHFSHSPRPVPFSALPSKYEPYSRPVFRPLDRLCDHL